MPVDTCVLSVNASTCFDTIIHNFSFRPGDVIICFGSIYGSFDNTLRYKADTTPLEICKIRYDTAVPDALLCARFEESIELLRSEGKNICLAVFDTCNSLPGVRMPFERLTDVCKSHKILSCIDGAHGIGQFPLDLTSLDPDFFMSNCHKWLHVPRACAVLYVPTRNQHLLRATLPTGFAFVSSSEDAAAVRAGFVANFASVGTLDDTPFLCIEAALQWRSRLTWNGDRGESAIMNYTQHLARIGGEKVAQILGTFVLDNEDSTWSSCSMTNVRLPITRSVLSDHSSKMADVIAAWIMQTMILEHEIAVNVFTFDDGTYARMCAQVYNTLEHFERAGFRLKEACERARNGEWKS